MKPFIATDAWYKKAAEEEKGHSWDTADVKTCAHGFVFLDQCEQCKSERT